MALGAGGRGGRFPRKGRAVAVSLPTKRRLRRRAATDGAMVWFVRLHHAQQDEAWGSVWQRYAMGKEIRMDMEMAMTEGKKKRERYIVQQLPDVV